MNKAIIAFLAVGTLAFTLVGTPLPRPPVRPWVQLDGRVQWIAGQKLLLLLDSGGGVDVDIARVPLDQYVRALAGSCAPPATRSMSRPYCVSPNGSVDAMLTDATPGSARVQSSRALSMRRPLLSSNPPSPASTLASRRRSYE